MARADACLSVNSFRKVVPADNTFVREVIDAGHDALLDDGHDGNSQVACIGGRSYLVEDDPQLVLFLSQSHHGLHEVVAEGGVEPCRADDDGFLAELLHAQFAGQLRRAVDTVGTRRVIFHIGRMLGSVEHVVGGNLNNPSATLLYGSCQVGWGYGVERSTQLFVALGLVDSSIGGTVHDAVNLVLRHELFYGQKVGDVELFDIGVEPLVLVVLILKQLHLITELSVATCNQYVHSSSSPALSLK